jgi:RHS repeat-associated protein
VGIQGTWPAGQWCQRLGYDEFANAWGNEQVNLAGLAANGPAWYLHQSGAVNNQIKDVGYDVAGNQTQYLVNNLQRVADYDGEGRIWRVRETGTSPQTLAEYSYDGEGRRVKRATGGETTFTVYDMQGRAALEYQAGGTWTGTAGAKYWFTDHLGSTRMRLKADGTEVSRADYEPFGAEIVRTGEGYGGSGENPRKFTGKERDAETGLDYFGARYMSAPRRAGSRRPDPLLNSGRPWLPQSWNRYAYTLNNPLRFTDPTGLYEWDSKCKQNDSACEQNRQQFRDAVTDLQKAASTFKEGSKERQQLDAILDKIGTEGDGNKTRIAFNSKISDFGQTFGNKMTFNFKQIDQLLSKWDAGDASTAKAALVGHEGQHLVDGGNVFGGLKYLMSGAERVRKEIGPHTVESYVFQGFNRLEPFGYGLGVQRGDTAGWPLWNPSWATADAEKLRQTNVGKVVEELYNKKK